MAIKLEFNRVKKVKMVGVRLTQEEYGVVEKLAKNNKVSIAEACAVLIRATLKELS